MSAGPAGRLDRRAAVASLLKARGEALIVCGLGSPVWDVAAIDHRAENFYLWGGMGGAAMLGLGLAQAQPERRIWVITGDGEALMGMGALATIGVRRPGNLAVIVLDNERYGETGMQPTHTAFGVDLAGIARSCGLPTALTVRSEGELAALADALVSAPLPLFASVKVAPGGGGAVLPPRDGVHLKNRFRAALLGDEAALHPGGGTSRPAEGEEHE